MRAVRMPNAYRLATGVEELGRDISGNLARDFRRERVCGIPRVPSAHLGVRECQLAL